MPLTELVEIIKANNSAYSEIPYDTSYFRSVEYKLEECFVKIPPEKIRAEFFTVYLILEHILTVLTGDVRYHAQSVELVREVFGSICKLLTSLIPLVEIEGSGMTDFKQAYADTVRIYLENVHQINELLKKKA
jgi:hypothetical protein